METDNMGVWVCGMDINGRKRVETDVIRRKWMETDVSGQKRTETNGN